jgi:hypothetical protein
MCGGGGVPPPPAPDPSQVALQQEQLKLLQQQSALTNAFVPLQAEQAGYEAVYGPNPEIQKRLEEVDSLRTQYKLHDKEGTAEYNAAPQSVRDRINQLGKEIGDLGYRGGTPEQVVVGYKKSAAKTEQDKALAELQSAQMATSKRANDLLNKYLDSLDTEDYKAYQAAQQKLQEQQTQVALAQGERQQKALKGELPLSEGTIQRKTADFQLLKENLARGGNAIIGDDPSTAYSLSSPGEQALKEFNSRYSAIEGQERQGTLDSSAQTYLQSVGLAGNLGQSKLASITGLSQPGGYAATSSSINPMSPVQNNLSLVGGYSAAMQPYLQMQEMQNQNNQMNAQIRAQDRAGYMQLGGTALGSGAALYALSNRKEKKNIEPIKSEADATRALAKTPVYRWNYKSEPDGHKRHLGTMTDEAPDDVVTEDGRYLDVTSYLGLLTLSAKDLHGRLLSLEGARS